MHRHASHLGHGQTNTSEISQRIANVELDQIERALLVLVIEVMRRILVTSVMIGTIADGCNGARGTVDLAPCTLLLP